MLDRREFLKVATAPVGALVIATFLPLQSFAAGPAPTVPPPDPNAFIRIGRDNTVTVIAKHLDMGQGPATGLTTLVAEELDADWSQMRSEFAPAEVPRYGNFAFGGTLQGTGGSTAIANSWLQLRRAGAACRQMLVTAAAKQWQVPAAEITVEKGVLRHAASGRHLPFGAIAGKAAKLPVPQEVTLKNPSTFKLIGNSKIHRIDYIDKTNGRAKFGLDIRRPGMVRAVIARPPLFGAKAKSLDSAAAKAVKGVVAVVEVPSGVAVVAKDSWTAMQARDQLKVTWDETGAETRSSAQILADYKSLAEKPGLIAAKRGDTEAAFKGVAKVIEAAYSFPYLAHAPMEPLNAVVEVHKDGADIWTGSQFQTVEQMTAAHILGLRPEQVRIHTVWAGGSFGRRANTAADYIAEAASVAKALGGNRPVQLLWSREDDIRGGYYRPLFYHQLRVGLDAQGNLIAWEHRIVGQSLVAGTMFEKAMVKDGIDASSVEGASDLFYAVPNLLVDLHSPRSKVPVLWWRSVGHTHTGYVVETMIDEAAAAAGKDPLAYRLALLADHPKQAKALRLAAEKADWSKPLPKGSGRGIAVRESFGTTVAEVAEVTVAADGGIKVDRVVCAVDCGTAVNPDVIVAQMEGGIGFGLGAVMKGAVTLTSGAVDQSNFDGYQSLRISEMPKVEVHIVPSSEPPTGVGEPGVPPIGPAVANAVFAASGRRIRDLPFVKQA